ncbi:hypothetical protein THMIRHAS_24250 [Thiosulfatimonas sediminis]|uniref:Uncharacterized protein n=1 Tax=Thiosulfatimonas sediminis TaxID=2675054 RepID=A0A6F8PY24_9GAMM|nr:hypothetical protein [Thiosulfatimonas sediminis]BBP47052.1 hypothetical protein THMIRHAS_24250 [Thiosulfatimonas sediminis]
MLDTEPLRIILNSHGNILNYHDPQNTLGYGKQGSILIGHSWCDTIVADGDYQKLRQQCAQAQQCKDEKFITLSYKIRTIKNIELLFEFYLQTFSVNNACLIVFSGFEKSSSKLAHYTPPNNQLFKERLHSLLD